MERDILSSALYTAIEYRWSLLGGISLVVMSAYVIYMRYLHPLARYPGPFIASLTNLWKAYSMYQGQMEYVIHDLHKKHGAIVRIGPNDLVISHADAVKQIYLAGSSFQKVSCHFVFIDGRQNSTMASPHSVLMYSELKMKLSTASDEDNYRIRSHKFPYFRWNHTSTDAYLSLSINWTDTLRGEMLSI